jgi:hypothetical protein
LISGVSILAIHTFSPSISTVSPLIKLQVCARLLASDERAKYYCQRVSHWVTLNSGEQSGKACTEFARIGLRISCYVLPPDAMNGVSHSGLIDAVLKVCP